MCQYEDQLPLFYTRMFEKHLTFAAFRMYHSSFVSHIEINIIAVNDNIPVALTLADELVLTALEVAHINLCIFRELIINTVRQKLLRIPNGKFIPDSNILNTCMLFEIYFRVTISSRLTACFDTQP